MTGESWTALFWEAAVPAPVDAASLAVVVEHARRGVRLQVGLRVLLAGFLAATVLTVPAQRAAPAAIEVAVVAGYLMWVTGFALWFRRGRDTAVRLAWLALFADLAVLTALSLVAGLATPQSWTADVLAAGFGLVPVLAATELRPQVCAAVVVPTVGLSLAVGVVTQAANAEPAPSLALRTLLLTGVGLGCVGLSRIQRSRVATISGLLGERSALLGELGEVERRERQALAESLHDGALQYVLAARQDLEDARESADPAAFDRLDEALSESSTLLRATVTQLHPAVLESAGLPAALRELAATAAARAGYAAHVEVRGWPEQWRTGADALLYRTARELLGNVAAHAAAHQVTVVLDGSGPRLQLVVSDDGRGIEADLPARRLADGHIGLASHALRVEAAGGVFTLARGLAGGTVATVEVPRPDLPPETGVPRSTDLPINRKQARSGDTAGPVTAGRLSGTGHQAPCPGGHDDHPDPAQFRRL